MFFLLLFFTSYFSTSQPWLKTGPLCKSARVSKRITLVGGCRASWGPFG